MDFGSALIGSSKENMYTYMYTLSLYTYKKADRQVI